MLIDLKTHCSRLVGILGETELVDEWEHVADWLQLAAAIESVEVNTIQFQGGFGYCSAADEYSMAREKLLNEFVLQLSRFSFVWGALECCLNKIKPPAHPNQVKRGKISNACHYLSVYFEQKPPPLHLAREIESFRVAASQCYGFASVEKRFAASGTVGWPGNGLYMVYELRNLFAHGSLRFPEPDEENQPISDHRAMILHATRVVLISIQMLLLAHFRHSELPIPFTFSDDFEREHIELWLAVSGCHLESGNEALQLPLLPRA